MTLYQTALQLYETQFDTNNKDNFVDSSFFYNLTTVTNK